jgi:hypothetical protein
LLGKIDDLVGLLERAERGGGLVEVALGFRDALLEEGPLFTG